MAVHDLGIKKGVAKIKDIKRVNKARKELGLQEVKYGDCKCLRCDEIFYSYDIANNRLCIKCVIVARNYQGTVVKVHGKVI